MSKSQTSKKWDKEGQESQIKDTKAKESKPSIDPILPSAKILKMKFMQNVAQPVQKVVIPETKVQSGFMQFQKQNALEFYSSSDSDDHQEFQSKIMFSKKVFGGGGAANASSSQSMLKKRKHSGGVEDEPKKLKKGFWDKS